ncbi:hypothetical protein AEB_P2156 [Altererythrobacter sp. B11]|nr:hypothetical protein AEB_P2156 [Altererythrobacter sp. B11]
MCTANGLKPQPRILGGVLQGQRIAACSAAEADDPLAPRRAGEVQLAQSQRTTGYCERRIACRITRLSCYRNKGGTHPDRSHLSKGE